MAVSSRLVGVGVFVISGLLLFAVGLFMIGDRQMAFVKKFTIYTELSKITGLQTGAIVRVSGAKAGTVKEIIPPRSPSEKFKVKVEISEALHPIVRTDSIATIETEGLVGGSYLSIATGSEQAPQAPENSTIAGKDPFALNDLFQQASDTITKVNQTIDDLKGGIDDAVKAIGGTVENANALIDEVRDDVKTMASSGARISADAADIIETVRKGQGTIGKLVKDDELYRRATSFATSAEQIANDARDVVERARKALTDLQAKDGPIQGLAANLTQTMNDARVAMSGFAENMEALKRNFFFRGFFNERGFFNLADISPARYRQGLLAKDGQRVVARVWLGSAVIFDSGSDQSTGERLTDSGKARLESALQPYLPYLGESVLIVEGYAQRGTRDEQFVQSRIRASTVREYLIGKFHLNPQLTGVMPLGSDSADSPNTPWDGVALAVFLDRRVLAAASNAR